MKETHLRILEGYEVVHLLMEKDEHAIRGVQFRERTHSPADKKTKRFDHLEDFIALLLHDQSALLTFLEVIHMLRSPLTLLHPLLVAKVLMHKWKGKEMKADAH